MYNPAHFAEGRTEVLHALIRQRPLATLVTSGPEGLEASHIPLILDRQGGLLRGHLARANPQWRALDASPVLAIFQGPEHYVTPSWYAAKREHGKVVPTWNYVAVHVWGRARWYEDPARLLRHLHELTNHNEASFEAPWGVDDAPPDYIEGLTKAIAGFEISIERMEGKWKLSQNRSESDQQGVVQGLEGVASPRSLELARVMKRRE